MRISVGSKMNNGFQNSTFLRGKGAKNIHQLIFQHFRHQNSTPYLFSCRIFHMQGSKKIKIGDLQGVGFVEWTFTIFLKLNMNDWFIQLVYYFHFFVCSFVCLCQGLRHFDDIFCLIFKFFLSEIFVLITSFSFHSNV